MNLQEIKTNMEQGVIVSRLTWEEVVKYALALEEQRDKFAAIIATQLAPQYVTDNNGPDAWSCQCCLAEARGTPDTRPKMEHDPDCMYMKAEAVHAAAIARYSGPRAFTGAPDV